MYCIREHLLFDRSYIIYLKQDSIDIGESTQKIKYVIPMNSQTMIDWKVNEENQKLVAFAIFWNGQERYFYADENVLLRVKEYMDGKVIYYNMDLFFEAIKKPESKQQSSKIQLIKRIDHEQIFALKEMKKLKKNSQQLFQNEVESLRQLKHKNIVKLIQIFESDSTYQIVLQYLRGGSLSQCLKYCKLNSQEVIIILHQILEGINHIHKNGFVHRDIKPENILFYDLGQFSQLYIIDFASAGKLQELDKDKDMKFGTPGYMAPELFDNSQKVSEKVDIFACGAILYQMLTGLKLIIGSNQKEIMENNKNFTVTTQILQKIKSNDYQNLIAQMLEENPQNRISASEALNYLNLMKIQTFTGSLSIQIHHNQEPVQKLPNFKKLINKQ
ncbi:unnamed protein product (macronuclear) [Paramecium tetraurelia]|uniref:Protein kinase domain-containing protein n=1 Tax=Paramecium tetraurelia TaxID=5888 RepID=A0CLL2_PARTE|nr:uncharacterized protein GSPATT00008228001 [Paramecium tetraurelia]CAK71679.1 unnamed protein product [Paramecium tetraurelia]|eukprot:XP_001439076.1 hypothetical protein (macronuclear) [Paramecium tetraurelia strain d4-2]